GEAGGSRERHLAMKPRQTVAPRTDIVAPMAKKSAAARGGTPAVAALEAAGVAHTVHAYEHDPRSDLGYGLEAAHAIGVDPGRVLKTLLTVADGALVVGVVPV